MKLKAPGPDAYFKLAGCVIACQMAGIIGSFFTIKEIPTWYAGLVKPQFNPPNSVFGPVWTTLYLLMGIAVFLIYQTEPNGKECFDAMKRNSIRLFWAQLALNALWSILFFGAHQIGLALIDIILLWGLIGVVTVAFYKLRPMAGFLMIPYWLWVSYAVLLNFSLWRLNP